MSLKSEAEELFGGRRVENSAAGVAEAMILILKHRGMEYNDDELRRWCQFDFHRRYGKWKHAEGWAPPPITGTTIQTILRTYLKNWYDTHMKWARQGGVISF